MGAIITQELDLKRHGEVQVQELQSGDIVLCDSYRASWSGYAIERDGKIVAIARIMLCC